MDGRRVPEILFELVIFQHDFRVYPRPARHLSCVFNLSMTKPISRVMHGILTDYPYIAVVSSAPKLFGFQSESKAALMTRVLSGTILISSILTRAEWGFLRVMPYKIHLVLDTLGGATALAAPWVLGFSNHERARNFFLVAGVFGLLAGLGSEPEEMDES